MKHLIPIGFAFSGAYLVDLPLYSQVTAVNLLTQIINPAPGASFSSFPAAPYLHIFIPWVLGAFLLAMAVVFATKSYRE